MDWAAVQQCHRPGSLIYLTGAVAQCLVNNVAHLNGFERKQGPTIRGEPVCFSCQLQLGCG